MKAKSILLAMLAIALFLSSCSKDTTAGPAGPQGANGNATMYVVKFTVDTLQWAGLNTSTIATYKIAIPQLTPQVISNGVLQVFYNQDTNSWKAWSSYAHPLQGASYSNASDTLTLIYSGGASYVTGADFYNPTYFKVVIIAP